MRKLLDLCLSDPSKLDDKEEEEVMEEEEDVDDDEVADEESPETRCVYESLRNAAASCCFCL